MQESKVINGIEILWDTTRGTMSSIGHDLAAFWLDPSLLSMLAPLKDELGTELFQLVVADSASRGTKADYESMVTVFAHTFEEGFLAWGKAVGVVGWGRFELTAMDREAGTATVVVRSPWELLMQANLQERWGCPFMRGKLIGIFRHALGVNCWATESAYEEGGEPVVEFALYRSSMTIEAEVKRLRAEQASQRARWLQEEVDLRTGQLRDSEARLRATLASMNSWVLTMDAGGCFLSSHMPSGAAAGRFPDVVAVGRSLRDVFPSEAAALIEEAAAAVRADGQARSVRYDVTADGEQAWFACSMSVLNDAAQGRRGLTLVIQDITAAYLAEEKETQLRAQLRQAQKMEAIGQLTGGVAHDFNNLLTSIYGNLELALAEPIGDEARSCIENALASATSAATLTHRLLAFSRRQPLQPYRVDPRNLVTGMEVLLRRTLGEHIDIEVVGSAGQWQCEIDGTQLESAILNLAINARDAMPDGGKITIETGNVRISPEYAEEQEDLRAGQYVMVAISDTGAGMSEEVQRRAFDPFFTTKGLGKGSGLGLSMVYGFVRQSRGHIKIYSEIGVGTTVKLYLPRSTEQTADRVEAAPVGPAPRGDGALVLVVEDDAPVRRVSVRFLESIGYRTRDCGTALEALQIMNEEPVDLLFTDVVLPGDFNGAQLARAAQEAHEGLAVLYTSGYTENAIVHHGRLDVGVHLVEKPFTRDVLARRVHAALGLARSRR